MASSKLLTLCAILAAVAICLPSASAHTCPTNCAASPSSTDSQSFFSPNVTFTGTYSFPNGIGNSAGCKQRCITESPFGAYYQWWLQFDGVKEEYTCVCYPKCCVGTFVPKQQRTVHHGVYCTVPDCPAPPPPAPVPGARRLL